MVVKNIYYISLVPSLLLKSTVVCNKGKHYDPDYNLAAAGSDDQIKSVLQEDPEITLLGNSLTGFADWKKLPGLERVNTCTVWSDLLKAFLADSL